MKNYLKQITWLKNIVFFYRAVKDYISPRKITPLHLGKPWLMPECVDWMNDNLTSDMNVFEWGSGGSTAFIAPKVKHITSMEYNLEWYMKVKVFLGIKSIPHCVVVLREKLDEFASYILNFPNNYFDFIVVDGRNRVQCMKEARSKVKVGGYIMLDDAEREQYTDGIEALNGFKRIDFNLQEDNEGHGYAQITSLFQRTV